MAVRLLLVVFACVAFVSPRQALAVSADATQLEFFQRYESKWTGLQRSFEYCIEPAQPGYPLPEPTQAGERLEYNDQGVAIRFFFTLEGNEHREDNPFVTALSGLSGFAQYEYLDYRVYLVGQPADGFVYHRYYNNNEEQPTPEYNFRAGNSEAQTETLCQATAYSLRVWPQHTTDEGALVSFSFGSSIGLSGKVGDPGWTIRYTNEQLQPHTDTPTDSQPHDNTTPGEFSSGSSNPDGSVAGISQTSGSITAAANSNQPVLPAAARVMNTHASSLPTAKTGDSTQMSVIIMLLCMGCAVSCGAFILFFSRRDEKGGETR
ncbi:MAG: hypothetical protein IJ125_01030 [Atopobiaceae bacterium]|nr:hypothetical protein [Atopobiaceae bacterium]